MNEERKSQMIPDMPSAMMERYGNPDDTVWSKDAAGNRIQRGSLWGFGGWFGNVIDLTLKNDDPEAFGFLVKKSGLDKEWLMMTGHTPEQYCELRGAKKCKAALPKIMAQSLR